MNIYLDLFLSFAKVGVLTFGGGIAMLPILEREIVDNKGWASSDDLLDYYAIGQCTPGIIAVNVATFIGKKKAGISGGIIATLGIVFPSVVIITLLASIISRYASLEWIQHAFAGIRVCVCVLMFNSVVKLAKSAIIDIPTLILFAVVLISAAFTDISPVFFVLLAAAAGIILRVNKR